MSIKIFLLLEKARYPQIFNFFLTFPQHSIFQFSDTGTAPFFGILHGLVKMPLKISYKS